jgi:hypothetical protein
MSKEVYTESSAVVQRVTSWRVIKSAVLSSHCGETINWPVTTFNLPTWQSTLHQIPPYRHKTVFNGLVHKPCRQTLHFAVCFHRIRADINTPEKATYTGTTQV